MRFHLGLSYRPKLHYLKWILLILGGLLAFFDIGNIKFVSASTRYTGVVDACTGVDSVNCIDHLSQQSDGNLEGHIGYTFYNWNIGWYMYGSFSMMAGKSYSFTFYLSEYSSVPVTGEVGAIADFKITSNGTQWTLDDVACAFDTFNSGKITCLVVPQNDYNNITLVRPSFYKNPWRSTTYSIKKYFDLDNESTYYNELNLINQQLENYLNSQQKNTQDIINNQNNNTQDIINNQNSNTQQIVDSNEEVKDTITDETPPNIDDNTFGDVDVGTSGAVSGLITMPITLLNKLNNSLNDTCTPYTIPFGLTGGSETLTFPCIRPQEYLGDTIWNYIDLFVCLFMVYEIAMLIISSFESITSLEDGFASLYTPRHAKPIGKHTSEVE